MKRLTRCDTLRHFIQYTRAEANKRSAWEGTAVAQRPVTLVRGGRWAFRTGSLLGSEQKYSDVVRRGYTVRSWRREASGAARDTMHATINTERKCRTTANRDRINGGFKPRPSTSIGIGRADRPLERLRRRLESGSFDPSNASNGIGGVSDYIYETSTFLSHIYPDTPGDPLDVLDVTRSGFDKSTLTPSRWQSPRPMLLDVYRRHWTCGTASGWSA